MTCVISQGLLLIIMEHELFFVLNFYINFSEDYDNCYSFASFYGMTSLWI
jgi:hypothetical protein